MKGRLQGYFLITLTILIVSSTEVTMKFLGATIPGGVQLNFWRFLLGGAFLLILSRNKRVALKLFPKLSLLAFLFIVVSMSCYQLAINESTAFFVAVVFSMNPVFSKLFEHLFEKDDQFPLKRMALPLIGMFLVLIPNLTSNKTAIVLALLSSISFGFYSWINKKVAVATDYDTISLTAYTFLVGATELLILSTISKLTTPRHMLMKFFSIDLLAGIKADHIVSLLFLSFVVTAGGFLLYFLCQRYYPDLSPVVFFSKPAVSLVFAIIFLNEKIGFISVLGIICMIVGNGSSLYQQNQQGKQSNE